MSLTQLGTEESGRTSWQVIMVLNWETCWKGISSLYFWEGQESSTDHSTWGSYHIAILFSLFLFMFLFYYIFIIFASLLSLHICATQESRLSGEPGSLVQSICGHWLIYTELHFHLGCPRHHLPHSQTNSLHLDSGLKHSYPTALPSFQVIAQSWAWQLRMKHEAKCHKL